MHASLTFPCLGGSASASFDACSNPAWDVLHLPVLVQIRHALAQGLKNAVEGARAERVGMTDPMGWKEQANMDGSGNGGIHQSLVSTAVTALLFINEYHQLMNETVTVTDGPKQGCSISPVAPTQTHTHTHTHPQQKSRATWRLTPSQSTPTQGIQPGSLTRPDNLCKGGMACACVSQTVEQWR